MRAFCNVNLYRARLSKISLFFILAFFVCGLVSVDISFAAGDGNLLKRSVEETCHACHKTNLNTPSVIGGIANPDWDNAIKMHSGETLGNCSNSIYKTRSECIDPTKGNGTWTPGKHAASGGWGVAGGVYGVFLCTTCHTAHDTKNIYLMKETITTPDGSNFAGRSSNSVIVDFRVKSGTAAVPGPQTAGIMGDDSVAHSTSAFICEVCHVYDATKANGVNKHAFNMSGTTTHNNAVDCTTCHSHKKSFSGGGCNGCHGNPPQDGTIGAPGIASPATGVTVPASAGAHVLHSTTKAMLCEACHTGGMPANAIPSNTIDMGFTLNATNVPNFNGSIATGTLNARAPAAPYTGYGVAAGTTVNITASDPTCSVYCHGSTMAPNGGSNTTPSWTGGSSQAACGTCHGASAANPPVLGSHLRHTGASPNRALPCSDCHNGYVPPAATTTHVNNQSEFAFDTSKTYIGASATYNGTVTMLDAYGQCSNVYCHSIVQTPTGGALTPGTTDYKTPTWGATVTGTCAMGACHDVGYAHPDARNVPGYNLLSSGSHGKHLFYKFDEDGNCQACHYDASYGGCTNCHVRAVNHTDHSIDVAFDPTFPAMPSGSGGGAYSGDTVPGNGFGSCSALYCHSKGTKKAPPYDAPNTNPVTWGGGALPNAAQCIDCHNGDNSVAPANKMQTGSHLKHIASYDCSKCHNQTVSNSRTLNPATYVGTLTYGYRLHANGWVNIAFDSASGGSSGTYGGAASPIQRAPGTAYSSCSSITCHGNATPLWGSTSTGCNFCHPYDTADWSSPSYTPMGVEGFGAHAKHITHIKTRTGASLTPATDTFGSGAAAFVCGTCHTNTLSNHMDSARTINFGDGTYKTGGSGGFSFLFDPTATAGLPATLPRPQYSGVSGTSSSVNPKSCSAVGCHFTTTPVWSSY